MDNWDRTMIPGHHTQSNDRVRAEANGDSTSDVGQVVGALVTGETLEDKTMPILEVCGDEPCPLLGHLFLGTGVVPIRRPGVIPCRICL